MTQTKATYEPLHDNVVIKRDTSIEKKSSGGIFLPTDDGPFATGKILAVGPGEVLYDGSTKPLPLKEGDAILFNWGEAARIGAGDEAVYIAPYGAVLARVTYLPGAHLELVPDDAAPSQASPASDDEDDEKTVSGLILSPNDPRAREALTP